MTFTKYLMATNYTLLDELTDRELEVIRLLGDGLSNTEIADQLCLAHSTVKWYIRQLNSKLDTTNRDEIVKQAQKIGLLSDELGPRSPRKRILPYQTTPFIGREPELETLQTLLNDPNVRLLTILAAGGMGKTRIALETAEQQIDHFPDGIYFVPLQPLSEIDQIIPTIAKSLRFQFQGDGRSQKAQILDFLDRKRLLLLMDNWEHLLDGITLVNDILQAAPHVKILTTSREKLNLLSEAVYVLQGMTYPRLGTTQNALYYDAFQLFLQTAKRIKSDWQVSPENFDDITHICHLTEGMPLAILLAASWLDVYDLSRIRQEIQHNADFLITELRDVPERQRSIRAIFDHTLDMLSSDEQQCFMKMSVFRGGFTSQAAETVTQATGRTLQSLLNKALLIRSKEGRYDVHELLRQYAETRLDETGDSAAARHSHMSYFSELLGSLRDDFEGNRQVEAVNTIKADFENILAAWYWAVSQKDPVSMSKMMNVLGYFYGYSGYGEAGVVMLQAGIEALRSLPDPIAEETLGNALFMQGMCHLSVYQPQDSIKTQFDEALALFRKHHKPEAEAHGLLCLGYYYQTQEMYAEQEQVLKMGLEICRELGDKGNISWALFMLSEGALALEQFDQAKEYALESLEIDREMGDLVGISGNLLILVAVEKDAQQTETYLQEILTIVQQSNLPQSAKIQTLRTLASHTYWVTGDVEQSLTHTESLWQISQADNNRYGMALTLSMLCMIALATGDYNYAHQLQERAKTTYDLPPTLAAVNQELPKGLRLWGQGDFPAAVDHFVKAFTVLSRSESRRTVGLSGMPFVLAYFNQPERAIALTHALILLPPQISNVPAWYLEKHAVWSEFVITLKSGLGDEAHQIAWKQGESLNLDVVIQELIAEFVVDGK